MDNITYTIKLTGAGAAAILTYLFGGVDMIFGLLLGLITLDYITGVIAAIVNKELSSEVGGRGIAKKVGTLIVVAVSNLIGNYIGADVRAWVIGYYIANEGISIIENAGQMGVPFPSRLINVLTQIKDKEGEKL